MSILSFFVIPTRRQTAEYVKQVDSKFLTKPPAGCSQKISIGLTQAGRKNHIEPSNPQEDYSAQPRSNAPALEAHFKRSANNLRVMKMNRSQVDSDMV